MSCCVHDYTNFNDPNLYTRILTSISLFCGITMPHYLYHGHQYTSFNLILFIIVASLILFTISLFLGIASALFLLIVLIILIFLRQRIRIAIALIAASSKYERFYYHSTIKTT